MNHRLVYLLLLCLLVLPVSAQERSREKLTHNDIERRFWLNLPPESDDPPGLIIMLHGANMSGSSFHSAFPIVDTARDSNYITVYPDSVGTYWHPDSVIDDADFIRILIDTLREQHNIDDNRIFIAGFSNGGIMALSAGCAMPDIVAGVVVLSANYHESMLEACEDVETPYPQMVLLSTTDHFIPWEGANGIISVEQMMEFEQSRFNCATEDPEFTTISTGDSPLQVAVSRSEDCDDRGELIFYRVENAPHVPLPLSMEVTLDNGETGDMRDLFWQFITNHSKNARELED